MAGTLRPVGYPPTLERAFALAQQAVALADTLPMAHRAVGSASVWRQQHDQAIAEAERAMVLDPKDDVSVRSRVRYGVDPMLLGPI
jgi:hypothetical protein